MTSEPTILVKKANGTSVRMSLAEFKKMKTSSSTQILGSSVGYATEAKKETAPMAKDKDLELKKKADEIRQKIREDVTKVNSIKAEEAKANKWASEDHKSLLDDEFHRDLPVLVKDGEHILARSTPVVDMFENMAEADAKKSEHNQVSLKSEIKSQNFNKPKSIKNIELSSNDFIMPIARQTQPRSVVPTPLPQSSKPVMSDIKRLKVEKQSVGPIDEIRQFTLEDFRRLGANTMDSAMKLKEKFKYLEADSYLMFMEGAEAWYNSPLYKQYQAVIAKSLKTRSPISDILSGISQSTDLKLAEFKEILKFNQTLY